MHPLRPGRRIKSQGGYFSYQIIGACCRLYDREDLPWPSCSLQWRGKQPSWNRIGKRLIADIAASKCPSYYAECTDMQGHSWEQVLTFYDQRLHREAQKWWYSKVPANMSYPELNCDWTLG